MHLYLGCSAVLCAAAGLFSLQCMMSGLALGTAVLYADLYFILKNPEVLEVEGAKSRSGAVKVQTVEGRGSGTAPAKVSSNTQAGT